jgi:hypothetical protein
MIWLRQQHIPAVARAFGDRDRPHWQTRWRVDIDQALFELREMTRFRCRRRQTGCVQALSTTRAIWSVTLA